MNSSPMLNIYADSLGGSLGGAAAFLSRTEVKDSFASLYILPNLFQSDLDRGFSVISYDLNTELARVEDIGRLRALGLDVKLDFVLNHLSVQSPEFQDILQRGEQSPYRDFFIDWNRFWDGKGTMTEEGYIRPDPEMTKNMFFRKPGLPLLMVTLPDGRSVPYWNTFYQEVRRDPADGHRTYLGQMDLNIQSPLVWDYYQKTIAKLAGYGASIIRLDAFAYAPKAPGRRNFLNQPETWRLLERLRRLAEPYHITLLPEIHASYVEQTYVQLAEQGYMTYDFFLPGLIINALENGESQALARWAEELQSRKIRTVNMLGCHDGIPMLDLTGLIPGERIQGLMDTIVGRGGLIKNLHGKRNLYYQVNATYYSALGEDDRKLLLARALQLFMPGKPQIWYLDLFAGKNDYEAVQRAGTAGHKEINRTNLFGEQIEQGLRKPVTRDQLALLRFRSLCQAFGFDASLTVERPSAHRLCLTWRKAGDTAALDADLQNVSFRIRGTINGEPFTFERA